MNGADRQELANRAERACVVLHDSELPEGCVPSRARIGVESTPDGRTMLHIEHGCRYDGVDSSVRGWLESGTAAFDSVEGLWDWVDGRSESVAYVAPKVDLDAVVVPDRDTRQLPDRAQLLSVLRSEIFGQEMALDAIAATTARHMAQREPLRPLSLMALGPTGTGKTATAELLARSLSRLTEGEYGVVRLDMVEYQEPHTTAKLFGSPPGYIGYRDGMSLVDALAENPRCVVIVDEIEKAHSNVLLALMTLMDTGRMSGGAQMSAQSVDGRRAILVFTSNLAAGDFVADIDGLDDGGEIDIAGRSHLRRNGVAPEIVGRLHRIAGFVPLSSEARMRVVSDAIGRSGRAYGLHVEEIAPELISTLLTKTVDALSGARSLGYLVDGTIGDLFADAVRSGVTGSVAIADNPPRLITLDTDCLIEE